MLTVEQLQELPPGVFASGETTDDENGVNIWRTGTPIHWVAVRGSGYHDWTIYLRGSWNADSVPATWEGIARVGDKCPKSCAKTLVACTDDAFKLYRN